MARGRLKLFVNRSGVQFANKLLFRLDVPLSNLETNHLHQRKMD